MVQNFLSKEMEMVSGWLYPSSQLDSLLSYTENKDETFNTKILVNLWHSRAFISSQKVQKKKKTMGLWSLTMVIRLPYFHLVEQGQSISLCSSGFGVVYVEKLALGKNRNIWTVKTQKDSCCHL